jgi:hypothetical protein
MKLAGKIAGTSAVAAAALGTSAALTPSYAQVVDGWYHMGWGNWLVGGLWFVIRGRRRRRRSIFLPNGLPAAKSTRQNTRNGARCCPTRRKRRTDPPRLRCGRADLIATPPPAAPPALLVPLAGWAN